MKKIFILLSALFILACLCFSGCGAGDNNMAKGQDSENTKVTLVLDWTPNTNHTGFYVADKLGYYKEMGIDLDIQMPPEDGAVALVASGKADFGIDFQDSMAGALDLENPMPVTAVAAVVAHNTSGIISLKEKKIVSFKDMEGKNYASYQLPNEEEILQFAVENDGGDYSKINVLPGAAFDAVSALKSNIDTIWAYAAQEKVACDIAGIECNFIMFNDVAEELDYYTPVIIANNNYLKQNPETAKAFLAATKKGYEYCCKNPEAAAEILCEAVPEIDVNIALEGQKYLAEQYISDSPYWGFIDEERWDIFYGWMFENKLTDKDLRGIGFTNNYLTNE